MKNLFAIILARFSEGKLHAPGYRLLNAGSMLQSRDTGKRYRCEIGKDKR